MVTIGNNTEKVNWKELIIFYIIAVGVSAPFRLRLVHPELIFPLPKGLDLFYHVLRGIGPAIAFFVVYNLLKSKVERRMSFWGINKLYSFISVLVIVVGLTISGVYNESNVNANYYGFLYGIMLVIYALGEEFGWRGYLQQALSPIALPYRILLIAILWYVWHLNFLLPEINIKMQLIHFFSLVLGSWGLYRISKVSRSILFAAAIHLSFNIFIDVDCDANNKLIILLCAAILWMVLLILLSKQRRSTQKIA